MSAKRWWWLVVAVGLTVGLSGCTEGGPKSTSYVIRPSDNRIRVAVLPFEVATLQQEGAGQVVGQEVITALLATGMFDVVDPGAVYQAMVDGGLRNGNGYGIAPVALQKLQDRIGPVRVFVAGSVQEFGTVQVGPASYPSISINARVIDADTGSILWSGSVSRTGADSEKFFGFGAVHSTGQLARAAVRDLISTCNRPELIEVLRSAPRNGEAVEARGQVVHVMASSPVRTGNEKCFDEKADFPEAALRALLVDVVGMTKGAVIYREHHYSIAEADYQGQGASVHAKVVDYRKIEPARSFIKLDHPDGTEAEFAGFPAYASASDSGRDPGAYHLDLIVGRFGVYVDGPGKSQADIEKVARAVTQAMK